jgi:hypothetical protein
MRDQAETKCRKLNMDMSPSQMQPTFPNSLRRQSAIKRRKGVLAPRFGRDASKRRVSNIPHMSLVDGTNLPELFANMSSKERCSPQPRSHVFRSPSIVNVSLPEKNSAARAESQTHQWQTETSVTKVEVVDAAGNRLDTNGDPSSVKLKQVR